MRVKRQSHGTLAAATLSPSLSPSLSLPRPRTRTPILHLHHPRPPTSRPHRPHRPRLRATNGRQPRLPSLQPPLHPRGALVAPATAPVAAPVAAAPAARPPIARARPPPRQLQAPQLTCLCRASNKRSAMVTTSLAWERFSFPLGTCCVMLVMAKHRARYIASDRASDRFVQSVRCCISAAELLADPFVYHVIHFNSRIAYCFVATELRLSPDRLAR